jgi:hypothetical protein
MIYELPLQVRLDRGHVYALRVRYSNLIVNSLESSQLSYSAETLMDWHKRGVQSVACTTSLILVYTRRVLVIRISESGRIWGLRCLALLVRVDA